MAMLWKKFEALGTEIIITADLRPEQKYLLDKAQASVVEFEQRFSRFIPDSELNMLNNFAGGEYRLSAQFADLLKHAQTFYHETNGLFDPVIIDVLEGIGYDRNFSDINSHNLTKQQVEIKWQTASSIYEHRPKMDELKMNGEVALVPPGFRLDLGGLGKGYVVDLIAREVFADIKNFWISAGGDLLANGNDEQKNGWQIGVQNPLKPESESFYINTLGKQLGIATSGVIKRKGEAGGLAWHHIIDPHTGRPAIVDILSVSVVAPSAETADVYAKTILLLGSKAGVEFADQHEGVGCIIFLTDGAPIFSRGMVAYL
ncbi:MAG: FAD:protein FMN transferase [Candidatus Falkowbacteria bacterium]